MTTCETVKFHDIDEKTRAAMKTIFTRALSENWAKAVPFKEDIVYLARQGEKIVGFCMIHEGPPQKSFKSLDSKTPYLYNFCVDPGYQRKGVGTALLSSLPYDTIALHMEMTNLHHKWLLKRQWKPLGKWREKFVEYVLSKTRVIAPAVITPALTQHYDPVENLIYLD